MSDISIGVGGPADAARLAMDAGNHAEAVGLLREAILDDPGDATLRADLGVALETLEDFEGSAQAYAAAAALEPDNAVYQFNQGAVAQAMGRGHDAAAHYLDALEREPLFAEAYYNLGTLFFEAGLFEIAAEHYGNALTARPDYAEATSNLGLSLRRLGRTNEAIEKFRDALRLRPDVAITHSNLGIALTENGDYDGAIACFMQALALDANSPTLHINLSLACRGAGRLDQAAEAALHALRLDPANTASQVELGSVASNMRRREMDVAIETLLDTWRSVTGTTPMLDHTLAALGRTAVPARAGDAYVAQIFDASAKRFDEMIGSLGYQGPTLLTEALARHAGDAAGTLDILDAGCGTGLAGPLLRPFAKSLAGVDLSSAMLQQAGKRGTYDSLDVAEIGAYLIANPRRFDAVMLGDVLCYFGELSDLFRAGANSLRADGWVLATVEAVSGAPFTLRESGRYGHDPAYLQLALQEAGLSVLELTPITLRHEGGVPVEGILAVAHKP